MSATHTSTNLSLMSSFIENNKGGGVRPQKNPASYVSIAPESENIKACSLFHMKND